MLGANKILYSENSKGRKGTRCRRTYSLNVLLLTFTIQLPNTMSNNTDYV